MFCRWNPRRYRYGVVEMVGLNQGVASKLFPGLCERSIDCERLAIADADGGRGRGRFQRVAAAILAALGDAPGQFLMALDNLSYLALIQILNHLIEKQQVLHRHPPRPQIALFILVVERRCLRSTSRRRSGIFSPSRAVRRRSRSALLRDQHQHARVLKQSGRAAERSDLEAAEESGERKVAKILPNICRIVIGDVVEPRAARDAIEVEAERGRLYDPRGHLRERLLQVVARPFAVTQQQCDRVPDFGPMGHSEDALFGAGPDDIADQVAAALDSFGGGIERQADKDEG